MSYIMGLAGLAQGVANGLALNQQKKKEDDLLARQQEQQKYDRDRQAVSDQQTAGLYEDQRKNNQQNFTLNAIKVSQAEREDKEEVKTQQLKDIFDNGSRFLAIKDHRGMVDYLNANATNEALQMQGRRFRLGDDGNYLLEETSTLNPSLPPKVIATITPDAIQSKFHELIDPTGAYKAASDAAAKQSEAELAVKKELAIAQGKQPYELQKIGAQNQAAINLAGVNGQIGMARDNNNSQNRISEKAFEYQYKPQISTNSSSKVASMVQGALSYVQQNPTILQGLSPEEQQLAIANIAIESGGNPNAGSPVGARGLMQIMPIARTDVMQRGAADPYSSPQANVQGGMVQLRRLLQKYNGDMGKAITANNWGEGNLDKHLKKYGDNWTQGLPSETATHLKRFVEANDLLRNQQAAAPKLQVASLVGARIDPLTKQVAADFKGSEITAPQIRGTLNQASNLLTQSLATNDVNKRKVLYSQAGQVIVGMLANSGLTPRQQYEYRDTVLQGLLGENDLASVGFKMGFASDSKTTGQSVSGNNKRAEQRSNATNSKNPFIDPDADLFKQAPGVDRGLINDALRGG